MPFFHYAGSPALKDKSQQKWKIYDTPSAQRACDVLFIATFGGEGGLQRPSPVVKSVLQPPTSTVVEFASGQLDWNG